MTWTIAGLIEGFYGRPWSWDERVEVMNACHERGMRHYVYAPKDDPKHRQAWREPYDDAELDGFRRLVAEGGLEVGFAISPGLSVDYASGDDRRALFRKIEQVLDVGIRLVCLALDDIPNRPGLGAEQADLTAWLRDRLADRAGLLLVPTEYVGSHPSPYLSELAAGVPDDVPIAWTGRSVVNDTITATQARERADALGGRAPLLWDNYPVNDAIMSDRLFMGPLWGRDPGLAGVCSGYLANPMVQPRCSQLPLASVAAWLRGDDPVQAWAEEATSAGVRVFAEACDGGVPRALVQALADEGAGMGWPRAAASLARWLSDAANCVAPGLEGEAGAWLEQVHAEAEVGLAALRLYQATKPIVRVSDSGEGRVAAPEDRRVLAAAFALAAQWPAVRRGRVSVMGPRCSFRPSIGQRPDGTWSVLAEGLQQDENAIDALARLAWAEAAAMESPVEPWVGADGGAVEVAHDGSFRVASGSTLLARAGRSVTRAGVPAEPPLPDRRLD